MYKVLIADDETIIRWGIKSFVEQDSDFQVVSMAEDGEMALEEARKTRPDVLFVDINMPFMNGFDFIKAIRREQPDAIVVIVTGYDEFTFAHQAIKLGVFDYVLKPIMEKPFFELLDRIKKELEKRTQKNKYLKWAQEQMEQHHDYISDRFLGSWMHGDMDGADAEEEIHFLHLTVPDPYTVFVVALMPENVEAWSDENLLNFACKNIIDELSEEKGGSLSFELFSGHIGVIVPRQTDDAAEEMVKKYMDAMQQYLNADGWCTYASGEGMENLPQTFDTAEKWLKERNSYSKLVKSARKYQDEHYSSPSLTLESVARELYVSPQYLSRRFRQETGQTFGARLSKIRINKAMELLQNPNLHMYEIAEQTGFSTQHYFSNAFKKAIGMAPGDYRRNVLHEEGKDEEQQK